MQLQPCTCSPPPVTSKWSTHPGFEQGHKTDPEGLWHVIQVDGEVKIKVLLSPSQGHLARTAALSEAGRQNENTRLKELRAIRQTGSVLNRTEQQELLDILLGI